MQPIKNIIFDLGNVIVEVDDQRTRQALKNLGFDQPESIFTLMNQNAICDAFEKGETAPEEFITTLAKYSSQKNISHEEIHQAWIAMILHTTDERLQTLQALRKHYRTFLLSNTNQIHHAHFNEILQNQHGVNHLNDLFDKAYCSFEIGMRKPDQEIYEFVLSDSQLIPQETLFIDDLDKNIAAAEKVGIQTWHMQDLDAGWQQIRSLLNEQNK